jgi:hypothetical protein
MHKKANKRILGMTQTELLILVAMSGLLLCVIVFFGGYIIYNLNRPIPIASPPTSMPTLFTQPSVRPANTSTLVPKATARPTFTTIPTATSFVIPTISIPTETITATTTATLAATPTVTPVPIETLIANLSLCEITIYEDYRFIIKYPAIWGCDKIDNTFVNTGPGGFIKINIKEVPRTAKEFCEAQIKDSHGLNQFGKNPKMEILQIDSQPACLILPSSDQSPKYEKASLLVVAYPKSIKQGTLLLISADKSHIRGFANTLRFVR